MNNTNLDDVPVYTTSGELKTVEKKESPALNRSKLDDIFKMIPESLDDPVDNKRY